MTSIDYSEAARHALANELDIIARKAAFDAERAALNAAHLVEQLGAARDHAALAYEAHVLAEQLRRPEPKPLTDGQRRNGLIDLAQRVNENAVLDEQVPTRLMAWATPEVTEETRQEAFDDLCSAVKLRDGLETGEIDPAYSTDATGPNRRDHALQQAHAHVDDALDRLLGVRRCVDCVSEATLTPAVPLPGKEVCAKHLIARQGKVAAARLVRSAS